MTGEMDSEHGLFPCKKSAHDQPISRRFAKDASASCAPRQDPR